MSVFTVEELQKMNKNELITIIGNYISDQEIWLNKAKELEEQNDRKSAEIEQLKKRHGIALLRNDDLDLENYELKKQVDELKEQFLSTCENCHLKKDLELLYYQKEQSNKDMAKEFLQGLEERKEQVKEFYGIDESVGVDIAIRAVKEILKQKGVEVE